MLQYLESVSKTRNTLCSLTHTVDNRQPLLLKSLFQKKTKKQCLANVVCFLYRLIVEFSRSALSLHHSVLSLKLLSYSSRKNLASLKTILLKVKRSPVLLSMT